MKRFEELPELDQCELLAIGLDVVCSESCRNFDELAQKQGRSIAEVWREVCAEAGKEERTFPIEVPRDLAKRN